MIILRGDWPYYFAENLARFSLPSIWSSVWPTGLGGNQAIILPLKLYLHAVVWIFVNTLGVPWEIVQIVFFFGLFIALSIYSSYKFTNSWIGALIYTSNTWILMVFFGGQMGIALAYAIAPLVLSQMIKGIKYEVLSIKYIVIASLLFAIQVMFDQRVSLLTILVFLTYTLFHYLFIKRFNLKLFTIHYLLLTIVTLLLHAFWILPSVFIALRGGNVASVVDTSATSLEFLSFAKFENSLSLLHPNWPENIFGKVAFMRPEFLIIPIIAFASLAFLDLRRKTEDLRNRTIIFFALVGLVGAFLAKGTQGPFGEVFMWLYSNIPGFNLFRDPVKFYILVAISYSVIIPYSLSLITKKNLSYFSHILFVIFWFSISLPFVTSNQSGISKVRSVPFEYVRLKNFLVSDDKFARTLWVPQVSRFGFVSDTHPTVSSQDLFGYKNRISQFKKTETQAMLQDMSIKYVIVPYDSEGEIFLNDRKYDEREYLKVIKKLDETFWLHTIGGFGKIAVYEISNSKPHAWSSGDKLIFAESFERNWYADVSSKRVYSEPFGRLNSFNIPQGEQSSVTLYYEPQKWATIGYIVSAATLLVIAVVYMKSRKRFTKSSNKRA